MGNVERSGSGGQNDWPVRLGGMVGGAAGGAIALFVIKPYIELPLWQGLIAFLVVFGAGIVLGQFVAKRISRPSTGGPSDQPPHA